MVHQTVSPHERVGSGDETREGRIGEEEWGIIKRGRVRDIRRSITLETRTMIQTMC